MPNQGHSAGEFESYTLAGVLILTGGVVGAAVLFSGPAAPFVAAAAVGLVAGGVETAAYTSEAGSDANIEGAGQAAQFGFIDALKFFFEG